ncbi:immunoglobulin E-set [Podospora fimiseda]|uniref:Rho GDP-dissociation inhibitor n=1 Tax=Podospora fimiseda TaxID=252190 RepID=A0AAN7BIA4_9PEZI|nr:immunoglobulin E-set [Podospora fimiseda]
MGVVPRITFLDPESQETCEGEVIWPPRQRVADTPGRPYGALPEALGCAGLGPDRGVLMRPYKRYGSPYPGKYESGGEEEEEQQEEDQEAGSYAYFGGTLQRLHSSVSSVICWHHSTNKWTYPDENDESLQRYKASLGLGGGKDLSDPNDPRVCIIKSLTMESPGRDPVVIDLTAPGSLETLKKNSFRIKEGATFTMTAQFKVQHEILSGLHYVQAVKRKGIRVSKSDEMIGSYAPNTEQNPIYTKKFQEEVAPHGMLMRGEYAVSSSFVDDDKKTHLQFDWTFEIAKDW